MDFRLSPSGTRTVPVVAYCKFLSCILPQASESTAAVNVLHETNLGFSDSSSLFLPPVTRTWLSAALAYFALLPVFSRSSETRPTLT